MEEEAAFKAYAAQPNLHERIFAKVAPNIFGHADIKKAVACLLFGGARKVISTIASCRSNAKRCSWQRLYSPCIRGSMCCWECELICSSVLHTSHMLP